MLKYSSLLSLLLSTLLVFSGLTLSENSQPQWITTKLPEVIEGEYLNFRLRASDKEKPTLSFVLVEGPKNMSLTAEGLLQYQAGFDQAGTHDVIVSVSDGENDIQQQFLLSVVNQNRPPVIREQSLLLTREGALFELKPFIYDADGDEVSLSIENAPGGLTIENDYIKWQTDFNDAGNYSFTLLATDRESSVEQTLNLTVQAVNRPPQWQLESMALADPFMINENETEVLPLQAIDLDGDKLSFRALDAPPWARVINDQLLLSPDFDSSGKYQLKLLVNDGELESILALKLNVKNTNRPPVYQGLDSISVNEGEELVFKLLAKDFDQDKLSLSLTHAPKGMYITQKDSSSLIYKADYEAAGIYSFQLNIADSETTTSQTLTLSVVNTNRAPQFSFDQLKEAKEGQLYQLLVTGDDPDNDPTDIQLISGPEGLRLNALNQLVFTPNFSQAGEYEVKIAIADNESTTIESFPLIVNDTNRLPVITSLPNQFSKEGELYEYPISVQDDDGDEVVISLLESPSGMQIDHNKLSWKPGFDSAGSVDISIKVNETLTPEQAVIQRFALQIENTNRLPLIEKMASQIVEEGAPLAFSLKATDPDQQWLRFAIVDPPLGVTLSEQGQLFWQPDFDQAGDYTLNFNVTDGEATVNSTLLVQVENVNRKPQITSVPMQKAVENSIYRYEITAFDADSTPLSYQLLQAPKGMLVEDQALVWQPDFEQAGQHQVVFQVSDGEAIAKQSFTIDVTNTNRLPEWKTPAAVDLNLTENAPWQLTLEASDPDQDVVRYQLFTQLKGLSLNKGQLFWQPNFDQAGEYDVTLLALDNEADTAITLNLNVENKNRSPRFTHQSNNKAKENEDYALRLSSTDPDTEDADSLVLTLIEGPEGMTILDETVSWLPSFDDAGSHLIKVALSDGQATVYFEDQIKVANTNRSPLFLSLPVSLGLEAEQYEYDVEVTDPDGQAVELTLKKGPKGLLLKEESLHWQPDYNASGEYEVELIATDESGASTLQRFTLSISNQNRLPVISSSPSKKGYESVHYQYEVAATDADKEALRYALITAPVGMIIDSLGVISWLPTYDQAGDHEVELIVDDGIDQVKQSYRLGIDNTNREPDFEAIPAQELTLGEALSLPLHAADIDGDPTQFQLIHAPDGMQILNEQLLWQPVNKDTGEHTVIISVSDGDLKVRRYFKIFVSAPFVMQ